MTAVAPASVAVRDVSATVDQLEVLRGVSLQVPPGELFAVLGGPASGKSALLRVVAGLERLDSGEVWLDDSDISQASPRRRGVALLPQAFALWPHMTVAENIGFALPGGLRNTANRRRCMAELAFVGLADFRRHLPPQLSAGQQQRIALARALAVDRPLCLLDDPFSAQTPTQRERLARALRRRQQRDGFTALLATAENDIAMRIADRIAVLHAGEVQQLGTPAELYDEPQTRQVATATGAVNLVAGEIELHGEQAMFHGVNGMLLPLLDDLAIRPRNGTLMFRPHALRVTAGDGVPIDDEIQLRGRVAEIEFLGDRLRCEIDLAGHPVWLEVQRRSLPQLPDVGDTIDLGLDPAQTRILEP